MLCSREILLCIGFLVDPFLRRKFLFELLLFSCQDFIVFFSQSFLEFLFVFRFPYFIWSYLIFVSSFLHAFLYVFMISCFTVYWISGGILLRIVYLAGLLGWIFGILVLDCLFRYFGISVPLLDPNVLMLSFSGF